MNAGCRTADLDAIDYFMESVNPEEPVELQMMMLEDAVQRELNSNPLQGGDRIVLAARYVAHVLLAENDDDDESITGRLDAFVLKFALPADRLPVAPVNSG